MLMTACRDSRNPKQPLATHTSTHSEDITSLHFDPSLPPSGTDSRYLLSGSTDGLLSLTNLQMVMNPDTYADAEDNDGDEEDAVEHVANWGCSIARCGWIPSGSKAREDQDGNGDLSKVPRVWSTSDMETMALWSFEVSVYWSQLKLSFTIPLAGFCPRLW